MGFLSFVFFNKCFFLLQVIGMIFGLIPFFFENSGRFCFDRVFYFLTLQLWSAMRTALPFFVIRNSTFVFSSSFVILQIHLYFSLVVDWNRDVNIHYSNGHCSFIMHFDFLFGQYRKCCSENPSFSNLL